MARKSTSLVPTHWFECWTHQLLNHPKQRPILNAALIRNNAQKKKLTVNEKEIEKEYVSMFKTKKSFK
jgi:hypothetical protein